MLYQHHAIFMEYKSLNIIREHGFWNDDRRGSVLKKESADAKCAKFWRERMQRRSLRNMAIVSVTGVTLT